MKKTIYTLPVGGFGRSLRFAVVSDLHGGDPEEVLRALQEESPDYILMPGDIFEPLEGTPDPLIFRNGLRLLREAQRIAPTFYSTGNHEDGGFQSWNPGWRIKVKERAYSSEAVEAIRACGVTLLLDSFVLKDGIAFGGLCSGLIRPASVPDMAWLEDFCRVEAPRVLLCHHPEYYKKYLKQLPIDLVVSGHAHGGQWRFFGRGVFAPGQGLFPKYTAGVHDGRLVISTGLKKAHRIPRFFNEPEVVFVDVK